MHILSLTWRLLDIPLLPFGQKFGISDKLSAILPVPLAAGSATTVSGEAHAMSAISEIAFDASFEVQPFGIV
jgi:hypothetical protein